ncbi:MAG: tetratricopeptide repeat protein [Rhodovulum sp.]
MRIPLAALLCLGLAALMGGPAPFGRLALALGLPGLAVPLLPDPAWKGAALARAGRFAEAAEAFVQAGPSAHYNRGVALARDGQFAAALEAFDMAAALNPADHAARANFDLVAAAYGGMAVDPDSVAWWRGDREGPRLSAPTGQGGGRAAGTGDAVTNTGANMGLPLLFSEAEGAIRKVFDDKHVRANARWLETLEDVPGAYLGARIAAEHKRRAQAGLSPPAPEDPR